MKQISLHAASSLEGYRKEMVLPGKPTSNMKLQADFRVVYCEATPDSADISPIDRIWWESGGWGEQKGCVMSSWLNEIS